MFLSTKIVSTCKPAYFSQTIEALSGKINELPLKRINSWQDAGFFKGCIVAYRTNNLFADFGCERKTFGLNGHEFGYISPTYYIWGDTKPAYNFHRFLFKHEIEGCHALSDCRLNECSFSFYDVDHWPHFYDGLNVRFATPIEIKSLKNIFESGCIKLEIESQVATHHILEKALRE